VAIPSELMEEKLRRFLEEDVGLGDLTTIYTVPSEAKAKAQIILKAPGVVAGLEEVTILLEGLGLHVKPLVKDGKEMKAGTRILEIYGAARTILMAERTVINILSRMSGIATATNRLVKKVRSAGYTVRIACTRKTAPGLLYFDKKAVVIGGGDTHRLHLDDLILIKDNHLKIAGGVTKAVKQAIDKKTKPKIIPKLPTNKYDIIYADPPWRYNFTEAPNRTIEKEYPTMELNEIKRMKIPKGDNSVLFLWCTSPKLFPEGMEII